MIRKTIKKEYIALLCVSLAWFLILSGRYSISNLLPQIRLELGFNWTEAGLALTIMWLFYAATQFPAGILSDIKGRKISILLAMLIFSISYILVGLSVNFIMFFFALILLGFGTGGYPAVGISMVSDIFKTNRGKALGIRDSAGSLAYGVPIIAAVIAGLYTWRTFFFLWAGVSIISIYVFYRGTEESTTLPNSISVKERVFDGFRIFKLKHVQLMFVINLCIAITWISYMSFFPSFLIVEKGFTELQAALALGILGIGGFIFKPIIGSLSDRYDKKKLIMFLSIITGLGTLAIVYSTNLILILIISFIPAFATAVFPIISSYLMDVFDEKGRAGKLGFYRSNLILLASPASAVIGFLADNYNFNIPFLGLSFILFLAAFILVINIFLTRK
jgi:MFS family permease